MNYHSYELAHALVTPLRWGARNLKFQLDSFLNPFSVTPVARHLAAGCEVFENVTRRYGKPAFGLTATTSAGRKMAVRESIATETPFCRLLHFKRGAKATVESTDPKVLLIAPLSGHYATLLRDTVRALLPEHEVYITDWTDARTVPTHVGRFDLDDYIETLIGFLRFLGPDTHVIAVCQPSVPALAAAAVMAEEEDPCQPASLTLMGGPIDTRRSPTAVNELARRRPISWFARHVISHVPYPHAGFGRPVYPGFLQLSGFMTMNLERHITAHEALFQNLIRGDCDSVKQHQDFYEEYLAVMDLPAEFYLQTVETVFQAHALPEGTMTFRGQRIDCGAIERTAIMTVEGEKDDICGLGQTEAAQELCRNVPARLKRHYLQPGVGHYGVFNGSRWRQEIQPRIADFIRSLRAKRQGGGRRRKPSLQ